MALIVVVVLAVVLAAVLGLLAAVGTVRRAQVALDGATPTGSCWSDDDAIRALLDYNPFQPVTDAEIAERILARLDLSKIDQN